MGWADDFTDEGAGGYRDGTRWYRSAHQRTIVPGEPEYAPVVVVDNDGEREVCKQAPVCQDFVVKSQRKEKGT